MQGIILILALAVVVEAVVEYIKSIGKMFATGDWKTAVTQLSAAAIAIALCFAAGADLFAALGLLIPLATYRSTARLSVVERLRTDE